LLAVVVRSSPPMPPYPGFCGPSYQSRSLTVDCERCLNFYPEIIESGNGTNTQQKFALYGTPGKVLAGSVGAGAGAALVSADTFGFADGTTICWYAIVGATLYALAFTLGPPAIVPTVIGTVASRVLTGTQLFPAQIIILQDKWLFVIANGEAFLAAWGTPISSSVLAVAAPISATALDAGGTGYAVGDTGTLAGGVVSAQYTVTAVAGGVVTGYVLTNPGSGYAIAAGVATTAAGAQPGVGVGLTISIDSTSGGVGYAVGDTGIIQQTPSAKAQAFYTVDSVDGNGSILTYTIGPFGAAYVLGTTIATTATFTQPGLGTGFYIDITGIGANAWAIAQQTIAGATPAAVFINYGSWMDGYAIVALAPNSFGAYRTRFYISNVNDPTIWNLLEFAAKMANPDPIVAAFVAYENLMLFGTQTMEIWYDTAALTFPMSRVQGGGVIEAGCASPFTICKMDGTIIWLGIDARGTAVIWELRGLTPVRVSNHAVETRWKDFNVGEAMAYVCQMAGHYWYILTFPNEDQTWVYDSATGQWHERCSLDGSGDPHADYGRYGAFAAGIGHGVLDYRNGNFYMQDLGYWDEAGTVIQRERVAPALVDDNNQAYYGHVRLLAEQGNPSASDGDFLGPNPTETPEYTLEISVDAGQTWQTPPIAAAGSATDTTVTVDWWRIGRARQLALRLRSQSRINHAISNLYIEGVKGRGL
jgi:hypothetical protein